MNRALWSKCVRDARWLLAACVAVVFAFCWVRVWMVSRIDTERFRAILDLLPGEWKKFAAVDINWLMTYAGRIALAFDEPIVVFGMSIWAIARGSDIVSGELNRGTMEMLLAQPLSRRQVFGYQAAVTMLGVLLLATAAWLGTFVGIHTNSIKQPVQPGWMLPMVMPGPDRQPLRFMPPEKTQTIPMSTKTQAVNYLPAAVNLAALGILWAGVSSLVSACDRYRWRTLGLVIGGYVVQMILKLIGAAVDSWSWVAQLSVFSRYVPEAGVYNAIKAPAATWSLLHYEAAGQVVGLGPLGNDLVLLAGGLLAYLAAMIVFQRRDLPAPL